MPLPTPEGPEMTMGRQSGGATGRTRPVSWGRHAKRKGLFFLEGLYAWTICIDPGGGDIRLAMVHNHRRRVGMRRGRDVDEAIRGNEAAKWGTIEGWKKKGLGRRGEDKLTRYAKTRELHGSPRD